MPSITSHQSNNTTKLLLIGDSGSGKTGSLASLAAAGYRLRIADLDNGLDVLRDYLTKPGSSYLKSGKPIDVSFITLTEKMKNLNGKIVPAKGDVWQRLIKSLDNWDDGERKLGSIQSWTPEDVLVIDSLSMLSTAALNFHLAMNGALLVARTQNEARRDIGVAQNLIRDLLTMLYDSSIRCNVIVNSHITFVTDTGGAPQSGQDAVMSAPAQGYPSAIGRALSPHIPRWFNSMLIARTIGVGSAVKHKLFTQAQGVGGQIINAKSSAPLSVKNEYPLETGLADYFAAVRGA